jgi:hypothetical protein
MTPNQSQQSHRRRFFENEKNKRIFFSSLAMMNTYNDLIMPNGNGPSLQQDFHRFSPSLSNNNALDLPYSPDLFMSSSPSGPPQQQVPQNRHMNAMQTQQQTSAPPLQTTMHQVKY